MNARHARAAYHTVYSIRARAKIMTINGKGLANWLLQCELTNPALLNNSVYASHIVRICKSHNTFDDVHLADGQQLMCRPSHNMTMTCPITKRNTEWVVFSCLKCICRHWSTWLARTPVFCCYSWNISLCSASQLEAWNICGSDCREARVMSSSLWSYWSIVKLGRFLAVAW